jgi:hypothetical protein
MYAGAVFVGCHRYEERVSIELVHPDGETFEVSDVGWQAVLELAAGRGWRPAEILVGLTPPFRINAREAAGLAGIIDGAAAVAERGEDVSDDDLVLNSLFSTRSAAHWRRFAAFCRAGEVTVRQARDDDEDDEDDAED